MLPNALDILRESLAKKGYAKRSRYEDALLDDLDSVGRLLDDPDELKKLAEGREKRAYPVMGPSPDGCPVCGRNY